MIKEMISGGESYSRRDLRPDNVKGLLIILVVIGHFLLPLYRTRFITDCIYAIYVFHMPCFVMLSGYFAKSIYKDGRYRVSKIIELMWLYFVFKMLVNITEGMIAGHIPLFPDFFHESGAPWYLLAMFFWYSSVPLIHKIRRPVSKIVCILLILLSISFGKYFVRCNDFLSLDRVLSFAPFFYIGYFCSEYSYKKLCRSVQGKITAGIGFVLLLAIFFTTYDLLFKYHLVVYGADYSRYDISQKNYIWLINLIWYATAFLISVSVIVSTPDRKIPILTVLGQNTLQIYILHRLIRDLWQYYGIYNYINPHSKLDVLKVIIFSIVLTVLLGNGLVAVIFNKIRKVPSLLLKGIGIKL